MILFSVVGVVALAYVAVCVFYYLVQERFIFVRFRLARDHRFKFPGPFDEVFIHSEDGAELHALHFRVERPKGVVLYFHGNTGSLRRWGKRAPRFTELGYEVLMPDYRGYGKSRGALSEEALHDDARRWYDHLRRDWGQDHIIVYGRSLGCGMAVPVAATDRPRALVLESPFCDLADAARHYLPILPYRLLLRYGFRNDREIRGVTCPITIFHGRRDNVVPFTSALKLYAAIPTGTPRELVEFARGNHANLHRFPRYHTKLKRALEGAPSGGTVTFAPPNERS